MTPTDSLRASLVRRVNSPGMRLVLIGVLLLLMNIPLDMIRGLIGERQERRNEAVADVTGKWGGQQSVVGPLLRVPYTRHVEVGGTPPRVVPQTAYAYFLPQKLDAQAQLKSQIRSRGIFEVPLYSAQLQLSGHFAPPDWEALNIARADVDWAGAELVLGLSDVRAVRADVSLKWNGQPLAFRPASGADAAWKLAGIHAPLGAASGALQQSGGADFSIAAGASGSAALYFAPMAEETTASVTADWPDPSYQGSWLPSRHAEREGGFTAQWSVSYLGRDFPQQWRAETDQKDAIGKAMFGVQLATPADAYCMANRIGKYAVLTLVFTFLTLWLMEALSGRRLHAIQYAFVGGALCLFGLLQLSFAEHFGFEAAFVVATLAVVTMVTLYAWSALRSAPRALTVGAILGGLYAYLYAVLRAEDYALLGGSLALFVALAAAMYLTRKLDWFGTSAEPVAANS